MKWISKWRNISRTKPLGKTIVKENIHIQSHGGVMKFTLGGKRFKILLKGMSDRQVKVVKTGDIVTLLDLQGRIIKELNTRKMLKADRMVKQAGKKQK